MTAKRYSEENVDIIRKYADDYLVWSKSTEWEELSQERRAHSVEYKSVFSRERIYKLTESEIISSLKKLWSYSFYVAKIRYADYFFENNELSSVREQLNDFIWGEEDIPFRFNRFIRNVHGVGPGVASEILVLMFPDKFIYWSTKSWEALFEIGWIMEESAKPQINGEQYQVQLKSMPELRILVSKYIPGIKDNLGLDLFLYRVAQIRSDVDNAYNLINKVIKNTSEIISMDLVSDKHKLLINAAWDEALENTEISLNLLKTSGKAIEYHQSVVDAGLIGKQLILKQRVLDQVKRYLSIQHKYLPSLIKIFLKLLNSLLGTVAMIIPGIHALVEVKEHYEACMDLKGLFDKNLKEGTN